MKFPKVEKKMFFYFTAVVVILMGLMTLINNNTISRQQQKTPETNFNDQIKEISAQSSSDQISDIEKDLTNTNLNLFSENELNQMQTELNGY